MENLNAEQVIKALECFHQRILNTNLAEKITETEIMAIVDALSLIKELTEENERLRGERAKFFEYKHGTLVRNALVLTKNKNEFDDFCKAIKADTVREILAEVKNDWHTTYYEYEFAERLDNIKKKYTEGEG